MSPVQKLSEPELASSGILSESRTEEQIRNTKRRVGQSGRGVTNRKSGIVSSTAKQSVHRIPPQQTALSFPGLSI